MSPKNVALVTGASKGIGEAIALKLAHENYDVIIYGRNLKRLESLKEKLTNLGSNTLSFIGDVADKEFVNNSIKEILSKYNKIDVLINNAGIAHFESFVNSTLEQFKAQIDTNLIGVYNFCKSVINCMIEKKNGTIINISSLAGKVGFSHGTMYSATKHAVMGFSRSLMQEVRKYDVKVVAVCPGSVATDMIMDSPIHPEEKQELLQPQDIADIVYSILKLPTRALISEIEIRPNNP
jgi:3-oxoacyl-[acyl-carrier protein] reductase